MPGTKITDPAAYLEKPATALQERFAEWIKAEVGYDPSAAKSKAEAFAEGVRLATATRMVFQASDSNREANSEARKANATKAKPPKKKAAKDEDEGEAVAPKKVKKAKPVSEDDEDEAPAPKTKKVKKAAKVRRVDDDEAPF